MFQPGDLVLVEVSGGPDSVCLLVRVVAPAPTASRSSWRCSTSTTGCAKARRPTLRTCDGSRTDWACRSIIVKPIRLRPPGSRWSSGRALPAHQRGGRDVAARSAPPGLADGHTRDDQAETILMALIVGWGLNGMGGIPPVNGALVRPLARRVPRRGRSLLPRAGSAPPPRPHATRTRRCSATRSGWRRSPRSNARPVARCATRSRGPPGSSARTPTPCGSRPPRSPMAWSRPRRRTQTERRSPSAPTR